MARILVVDDDEPTRQLIDLVVASPEHEMRYAALAAEALAEMQSQTPDLLIVDMRLPDMDGFALYRETRDRGYEGPVLVLTGLSRNDPLVDAVEAEIGPLALILKPFDVDDLADRIETALNTAPRRDGRLGGLEKNDGG